MHLGPRVKGVWASKDRSGFYGWWFEEGTNERRGPRGRIKPAKYIQRAFDAKRLEAERLIHKSMIAVFNKKAAKLGLKAI